MNSRKITRLAFVASARPEAQEARARLEERYGGVAPSEAEAIVALGGDGFMLETLHAHIKRPLPVSGMNRGSVGFLMNDFNEDGLLERVASAERATIHPLVMVAIDRNRRQHRALAINEVSLLRRTSQTAKLRISIDGKVRMEELVMALTPISAFRPRRWRGALLPHSARVTFEVLEADKRPVAAVADAFEVREVVEVHVAQDRETHLCMLFDAGRSFEERVLTEQFSA